MTYSNIVIAICATIRYGSHTILLLPSPVRSRRHNRSRLCHHSLQEKKPCCAGWRVLTNLPLHVEDVCLLSNVCSLHSALACFSSAAMAEPSEAYKVACKARVKLAGQKYNKTRKELRALAKKHEVRPPTSISQAVRMGLLEPPVAAPAPYVKPSFNRNPSGDSGWHLHQVRCFS